MPSLLPSLKHALVPFHRCGQCQMPFNVKRSDKAFLCDVCRAQLALNHSCCPRCAEPMPEPQICGQCLQQPPAFDQVITGLIYQDVNQLLLQAVKDANPAACRLAANIMSPAIMQLLEAQQLDIVCPIPISRIGMLWHRRHHSLALAKAIHRLLPETAWQPHLLSMRHHRHAQKNSTLAQRKQQLKHVFDCTQPLNAATVLVVDDIMTSGSTLHFASRCLKQAGASKVVACSLARVEKSR